MLAGYGGLSAATIYARLNLAACNVDRAAFERFTEFVRERAGLHAPDGASTRVEALAQLIVGHLALSGGRAFGVDVVRAIGYRLGVQLEGGKQT